MARAPVSHSDWLRPPTKWFSGKITAIDPDVKTIRICVGEGKAARTRLVSGAGSERPAIEIDGKPATFSALRTGMLVDVKARGTVALKILACTADTDNGD